jgi:inosine-uridine nucleoside N-ribohydrolase
LLYRELRYFKIAAASIGDAGAVACALLPSAATTKRMRVSVELQGNQTRGMTVCDLPTFVDLSDEPQQPANTDVVVDVDASKIKDYFARWVLA